MNYFDVLYKKQQTEIEIYSPIILRETAIIKDTVDDKILLRNIFESVCDQKVVAIAIRGFLTDIFGESIKYNNQEEFSYVYQDIKFEKDTAFGNKIAIELPNQARKAIIHVEKVVLEDGTVWNSNPENIVTIQLQREIEGTDEFVNSLDENEILPVFYYVDNESCWQCTCGEINKLGENNCKKCNRAKNYVREEFNQDSVRRKYMKRQAEDEKKRQKEIELARILNEKNKVPEEDMNLAKQESQTPISSKRTITKKYIYSAIGVAIVFIVACIFLINGLGKTSDDMIRDTKENVQPYVTMIGKETTNDTASVTQEFIDNLDNIKIMDIEGTVSHGYTDDMGDAIAMMDWESNKKYNQKEYDEFSETLNEYFNTTFGIEQYDNITEGDCLIWNDMDDDCWVLGWFDNGIIHLRWYSKEAWDHSN